MVSTNEHKNLRASSLSEAELEEKVRLAYLQTLMQSFLVGDLLKTGYFILISPIFHAHVRIHRMVILKRVLVQVIVRLSLMKNYKICWILIQLLHQKIYLTMMVLILLNYLKDKKVC